MNVNKCLEVVTVDEYKVNSGILLQVLEANNETDHFHMEIELVYVLEGTLIVYLTDEKYVLDKEKVLLINTNKKHSYTVEEETLLCKVSIDYFMIAKALNKDFVMFWCNSVINQDKQYEELCSILNQMIREYAVNREKESFHMMSLSYGLLACLTKNFLIQSEGILSDNEDERVGRILQYIHNHYKRSITLSELANQFYMSDSSFSRYFKKLMGINFVDYVNQVRLHYAIEALLYTNQPITNISMDCGFSNPSAFNKIFKEAFQISPTSYKKLMRNKIRNKKDMGAKVCTEKLVQYLKEQEKMEEQKISNQQSIVLDTSSYIEFASPSKPCINAGLVSDLLMGNLREQILEIKDVLRLRYIRVCNIFHPSLHIRDSVGTEQYNFDKIDSVFDYIIENGMYPIIDLGTKPKRLSLGVGKDLMVGNQEESRCFQNKEEWENLLLEFMNHIVRRYEEESVTNWLFELWYDEQQVVFDEEKEDDYMDYWRVAYKIIKGSYPNIHLGGNGLGVVYNQKKLQEHLIQWNESEYKPDFLTTYLYPYNKPGAEKEIYAKRVTNWKFSLPMIQDYERFLKELAYPKTDIYITEFNTSVSERNYYNDSIAKASHVAYQLIALEGKSSIIAYWHISDLLAQYYDVKEPLMGATGLLTKDGIPKPVFFTYFFMSKLGAYLIERGEKYMVTTNGKNKYTILVCNPIWFNHNYYLKAENEIKVDDLDEIFEENTSLSFAFVLKNLKNTTYHIKKQILNEEYGSVLKEWKNLGYTNELNKEDVSYLKSVCRPHVQMNKQEVKEKTLRVEAKLSPHEVMLITIYN